MTTAVEPFELSTNSSFAGEVVGHGSWQMASIEALPWNEVHQLKGMA